MSKLEKQVATVKCAVTSNPATCADAIVYDNVAQLQYVMQILLQRSDVLSPAARDNVLQAVRDKRYLQAINAVRNILPILPMPRTCECCGGEIDDNRDWVMTTTNRTLCVCCADGTTLLRVYATGSSKGLLVDIDEHRLIDTVNRMQSARQLNVFAHAPHITHVRAKAFFENTNVINNGTLVWVEK